jgi:hypothetical protein
MSGGVRPYYAHREINASVPLTAPDNRITLSFVTYRQTKGAHEMTCTDIEISNSDDLIDVRDVIARFEELESDIDNRGEIAEPDEMDDEFASLAKLLNDLKSNGGDEQWEGDWYPLTLIRDSYFEDYARELADDIGAIDRKAGWPNNCIDWEKAASELQTDYSTVDFEGVTYWYR